MIFGTKEYYVEHFMDIIGDAADEVDPKLICDSFLFAIDQYLKYYETSADNLKDLRSRIRTALAM